MKERPILFSAPMVRAILEGRKTVTRRLVTVPWSGSKRSLPYEPYWVDEDGKLLVCDQYGDYYEATEALKKRFGEEGDRLWVRETFQPFWADPDIRPANGWKDGRDGYRINYVADSEPEPYEHEDDLRLTPSIFMPRWASRILLEVASVSIERLHKITEEDAKREGIRELPLQEGQPGAWWGEGTGSRTPVGAYAELWDKINKGAGRQWADNPWVWRVEFRKIWEVLGAKVNR